MTRDIRTGELAETNEAVVELERLPQAIKHLSVDARRLIAASVSKNTLRGMRSDLRVYQRAGGLLPADEFVIANFIAEAHRQGKPDVAIKRISGHRDQRTFERYIRRTDEFEDHAGDFYPGVEEARV
ncbi:hypothetical protein [Halomonas sp. JS92-SW72]|uniref:hypothetical protein n=1 Tax=Halomonas sp. JS92-SW72 TaxID=2306583 RepID=UPI000E5AB148|nr:hypothetical protein [Halomonas sp. JS92-SW72]AXY40722.1 hypothetical protein D1793_00030 [Halomonas sp. JS92-SW72]